VSKSVKIKQMSTLQGRKKHYRDAPRVVKRIEPRPRKRKNFRCKLQWHC